MSTWQVWVTICAMTAMTTITRAFFILGGERVSLPPRVQRALRYAPAAALAVIVVPEVLTWNHHFTFDPANPKLLAAIIGAAWFMWRRRMVEMILVGMAVYTVIRLVF